MSVCAAFSVFFLKKNLNATADVAMQFGHHLNSQLYQHYDSAFTCAMNRTGPPNYSYCI